MEKQRGRTRRRRNHGLRYTIDFEVGVKSGYGARRSEYFYHANFRSPKWLRYFIQTPELHSIHHQLDVHNFNFSDIPIWDRIFGTYRDTTKFVSRCGFPEHREERLGDMLLFKDVYEQRYV